MLRRSSNPEPVDRLIEHLTRLPGVGHRSAERMAFFLLKSSPQEAGALAQAISDVKRLVKHCGICFNLTDTDPCRMCADPSRDASLVLIVEQPRDLMSLEQTGVFRGIYHVLMGRIDPLSGVGPEDITLKGLLARIDDPPRNARATPIREVILGLNPDLEGDTTALHLAEQLARRGVKVSRLARGLPAGSQLEYASKAVLADAIQGRQSVAD